MSNTPKESTTTRSWEFEVQDSTILTVGSYAFPSVLTGVVILVALVLGRLSLEALLDKSVGQAVLYLAVGVLALLICRWIIPELLKMEVYDPFREQFSNSGLLLGSVCGALILYTSVRLHPSAPYLVFIGSGLPLLVASEFPIEGHVTLNEKSFVSKNIEIPLQEVQNYRTFSAGALVFCRLSYRRDVHRAPRTVIVPREDFSVVQELLEEV